MLGFVIGLGTAFALVHFARHGHLGPFRGGRARRRHRREFVLDRLSARLQTNPTQDRALGEALDGVLDAFDAERGTLGGARRELASALRADAVDDAALEGMARTQDDAIARLRAAVRAALSTAHGVLDAPQRARLAELVERGPHHGCRRRGSVSAA